jgi:hypothetical protein
MHRSLVVFTATALALGVTGTGVAQAAHKPVLRSSSETSDVSYVGRGHIAGYRWHTHDQGSSVRLPHYAEKSVSRTWGSQIKHTQIDEGVLIGHTMYYNEGKGWKTRTVSPSEMKLRQQHTDPRVSAAKFHALPGVRHVGRGHYRVTGTVGQLASYLGWELFLGQRSFTSFGVKTVTIDLWANGYGWPTKITFAARSSLVTINASEVFTGYNKPVKITKP